MQRLQRIEGAQFESVTPDPNNQICNILQRQRTNVGAAGAAVMAVSKDHCEFQPCGCWYPGVYRSFSSPACVVISRPGRECDGRLDRLTGRLA